MKPVVDVVTLLFFGLIAVVSANSVVKRDVFVPKITNPHLGTILEVGQKYNVTWDTDNAPAQITNPLGQIIFAQDGRLVGLDHPLTANFSILKGWEEITVPFVETDFDYAVVLIGDSGNFSPNFSILNLNRPIPL
ncbi:hypothetical protein PsYK624_055730 [Phanerochaete sordida]|uniref:Uncharacterized protein n=1 Tax=Phanerochaete sordida TaxID=48140 RepID=A0A9P3LD26_9APHY|nr:hypothetical protein PsYK624_055730 [Phanerochaete sordida]